jgi:serine/threonine-protein phosphatase CPPED1
MKRLIGLCVAGVVLIVAATVSMSQPVKGPSASPELSIEVEKTNPWTHLKLNNDPKEFRFAVVSDRTGGHRAQIFSRAIERLNLMQPEFVVSVGDLIEGYTEEKEKLDTQWKEFNSYVAKLQMPFYYVPGNHDIANPVQEKDWTNRFGRRYYHFVYRDVLFLALDTEDPPSKEKDALRISEAQVAYVKKTLEANKGVRWTIVLLHKPMWWGGEGEKSRWPEVEKLLDGRNYTVFAGHVHRYQKFVRQGMNYYQLATTGGGSKLRGVRYGEFDHITWVTMKKDAPVIANVMLDGILDESLKVSETDEEGVSTKNRKPVVAASGKVTYRGNPVPNAVVVFYSYNATTKKYTRVSDALSESDGTFVMSSYKAFDGAPLGEYTATITWQEPRWDAEGKATPNKLPAMFATAEKSPLKVTVREGVTNQVTFDLR